MAASRSQAACKAHQRAGKAGSAVALACTIGFHAPRWLLSGLVLVLASLGNPAWAQSVTLQGMLGSRALIMVDGGAPKGVAVGDSHQGVKVISTSGDQAVLEFGGRRHTLRVGDAPASFGGSGGSRGGRIVMSAGSGGHFLSAGMINGRAVQFMVDTGATTIALGASEAQRVGLDFRSGQPVQMSTANGIAPGWRLKLASVRIGDVEVFDVDAVVSLAPMPYVLLGNSFLNRFQMKRDNEQMVLERRY